MSYEHKEDRGSLFRNDRKEQSTHPDYTGDINVGGTLYWLNAWLEETKEGKKYFSISVKPKEQAHNEGVAEAKSQVEFNDDIPFAWAVVLPLIPIISVMTGVSSSV